MGDEFHRAFLKTIEKVQEGSEVLIQGARWIKMDPIFGFVPAARTMLLEAEHDQLLTFDLREAWFVIESQQARKELEVLAPESVSWFMEIGEFLNSELEVIENHRKEEQCDQ